MARSFFALFLLCVSAAAAPAHAQTPAASLAQECLRLNAAKVAWSDQEASAKHRVIALETCRQAYAANGDDPKIKIALTRWVKSREESIPLLRSAIAQNDTEAMLALFNDFNSWDRHLDRPDLIPRAEAEQTLRRAAELGNPDAIVRLISMLSHGGPIKHDLADARRWAERLLAHPPKDMRPSDAAVMAGSLLSQSDNADERQGGIAILDPLA